jgi:membrane protein YqaA with SNARE-associated domain
VDGHRRHGGGGRRHVLDGAWMMHGFVHFFVSLPGLLVLGFLDAAFFFTLPLGIDAVVVMLAARGGVYVWLTPLVAVIGSIAGAALTYWTGEKIGDAGLGRMTSDAWVRRIRRRLRGSAVTLAALDLLPPPFPFSAFVLGAGAVKVDRRKFFATLAICRLFRFGVEALLGLRFGRYALQWIESEAVERIVAVAVVIAIAAGLVSLGRLRRGSATAKASAKRRRHPDARSPRPHRSRAFSPSSR